MVEFQLAQRPQGIGDALAAHAGLLVAQLDLPACSHLQAAPSSLSTCPQYSDTQDKARGGR